MSTRLLAPKDPIVDVRNLSVRFGRNATPVVKGISFQLHLGECLALVGESGSGKSVTSRTLVGLAGDRSRVEAGRLQLHGENLLSLRERHWRRIRGKRVGLIMQNALSSLDPLRPVGREIEEALQLHTTMNREQRRLKVIELLRSVGVPDPEWRARQYSHQLSGGLRQRALIASAIACDPELLIADEPTTALDAGVQSQILELLESLRARNKALLIISHDLAVVSKLADRIAVMHQGQIVEQGPTEAILHDPRHPYTQLLLRAAGAVHGRKYVNVPFLPQDQEAVVLQAEKISKTFITPEAPPRHAVSNVSFSLRRGETLGIVGESGSGKTTLIRAVLGLEKPDAGTVRLKNRLWASLTDAEQRAERRRIQVVFQDPLGSFDPRFTVEKVLGEALVVAGYTDVVKRRARAVELLKLVRLNSDFLSRRPIELSGGQCQRVAIARALAPQPEILVCDEPVSALDVSVQAQILDLLADLKERLGLSCLFISHDLGVIRRISDHVLVMKDGAMVEQGITHDVFERPQHPYTRELLEAVPQIELVPSLEMAEP